MRSLSGCIALLTLLFFSPFVQADVISSLDFQEINDLGRILITPKRVASNGSGVAENVIVYTTQDIQKLPAKDLGEVLSYMPGVDVQANGQFGQPTSLSINGASSRQVLLMVDGIPFNTQLSGQGNPAQIPIENIKQIELIKGDSSSAWGSSLGGVVNVITKDVGDSFKPKGNFSTSYAGFATTNNSLELSGKAADVGYFLSGSYFNTDGILDETNTDESKGFGKLAYRLPGKGELVGSFGYTGAHTRYGVTRSDTITVQPYNTRYGKFSLNMDEADFPYEISYKYNNQDIVTDILDNTGSNLFSTASSDLYQGLSLQGHKELFENHLLVMGADFDWHTIKSNQYLPSAKGVNAQAPYVNYTLPVDHLDVIPGLRYDHNDHFGEQVSPSLGTVYHFEDQWHSLVRAKVSRAFNAPPLMWIFNNDPSQFVGANPDLKAERALVYEVGAETSLLPNLNLELNAYRANVKDGIALVFDDVNSVFVQRNFKKFRRQGGELILKNEIGEHFMVYGSGGFNDAENRETHEIVRDQGIARQKFTFGTRYNPFPDMSIDLSGYYNRWASDPSLEPNDRKPMFDLKLMKKFEDNKRDIDLETYIAIRNLTNSKYWSNITFPLASRYFEGGLSLKF
jgi:vitamin B12 transporter